MLRICFKEEFIRQHYDAIFCFGAGRWSRFIEQTFGNTAIMNSIIGFVDNDASKEGSEIHIRDFKYKIYTPSVFKRYRTKKMAIIITCSALNEILGQLEQDENLKSIDVYYIWHFVMEDVEIKATQKGIPQSLRISGEPLIPKTIHYCWFGGNAIPDKYKIWMESWHKFCPDYEIKEWNESNYDITKNKYMFQAYEHKKWGFVPDYARLDIIYNYGGIYFDTDVEVVANFDELLYQKGFAGFEGEKLVNLGSGFGAVPGLPIIKEMMDYYEDKSFINEDGSLNLIASPRLQTDVFLKYGLKLDGEYQIVKELTIFPEKMLCGKNQYTRRIILAPYTKAIHHYDASWIDEETEYKRRIKEFESALNNF